MSPSQLTLAPGAEATFEVTFTRTDAELGEWTIGSLTWNGDGHSVRSPIAIQPVTVSSPDEVHGDASASGSEDFEVARPAAQRLDNRRKRDEVERRRLLRAHARSSKSHVER